MRVFISLFALSLSFAANAGQLNVAFGTSVPADPSGQTLLEKHGPSRASGGEHFVVKWNGAKTVTDIKLTAFSNGKAGKALIHSATGINGADKIALEGLSLFEKVTAGNPTNYKNNVMLADSSFVEVTPGQAFTQLDIVVEGFTNDDASLLLQITTGEALPTEDFLVTRTGSSGETVGGMINEAGYAKFSLETLQSLMSRGANPAIADVSGKTFVCTSWTKLNATELNFKSRVYESPAPGHVISNSDLEGMNLVWTSTAEGLGTNIDNFNGCGKFTTRNIVRVTGAGNLIAEVVIDLNAYVAQCAAAGYDPAAVQAVESNSTYSSAINPKYAVDSYEFCHLK